MRILHIIPDAALISGGPVAVVLNLTKSMLSLGHEVSIAATDYGIRPDDLPVPMQHLILSRCDFQKWRWSRKMKKQMLQAVQRAQIVHLHGMWEYPIWLGSQLSLQNGKPYVLSPCGMLEQWSLAQNRLKKQIYLRLCGRNIIDHVAFVHFASEREKIKSLPIVGPAIPEFVCPLGVDDRLLGQLPAAVSFRKRFPSVGKDKIILYFGRIHYKKQPDLLIKAFKFVLRAHPDTCLVIAGQGEEHYICSLKKLSSTLHINHKVFFTGALTGDAKEEALTAANIFALPSLQENFGIAVAEAMAVGCPVVISDAVDLSEDVTRAHAGVVCSATTEAFANALTQLLNDGDLMRQMGKNGRNYARAKFDWNKVAALLINEYEKILRSRNNHLCSS
jgi:glycosyltransferase involved in cell wall biosynthesis